jgi:hypothetical protein
MKTSVRFLGLTLALVLAAFSSADAFGGTCYVSCPGDVYVISPSYGCCGPISLLDFTCPGGGDAYGFAYDDGPGPQFCT